MPEHVSISPLTRIEGHLAIHTDVARTADNGWRVTAARCEGEMFRGFEAILRGRDPLDAQQITQRICGVCPISHGLASVMAQEAAYGIEPSPNGRLAQNLILAANYIQSHIVHFYHLAALDFVDITAVLAYTGKDRTLQELKTWVQTSIDRKDLFPAAPFLPRYDGAYATDVEANCRLIGSYAEAFAMRRLAHEMAAVFGAKLPHSTALVPGGCTQPVTGERILAYRSRLDRLRRFCETVYLPDVLAVAGLFPDGWRQGRGQANFLSFGVFREENDQPWIPAGAVIDGRWQQLDIAAITEDATCARFAGDHPEHPADSHTTVAADKPGAYSWVKAPRYRGHPMEVGPLARMMVALAAPGPNRITSALQPVLNAHGISADQLNSTLGRHLVRPLETLWLIERAAAWLDALRPGSPPARDFALPAHATGVGLTEAPRGALGHWLRIADHRIATYQCVVPTTWNCSPRDGAGRPGPVEHALVGTRIADPDNPLEAARVVRAFDPCLACAVH